jgi:AraC-like DNA-binding protein
MSHVTPFFAATPSREGAAATDTPDTFTDVCALIAATGNRQSIERARAPEGIARRVKEIIDQSYAAPKSFAEIAKDLKTSNAVLTRIFKRSYGISPILYRSHLRVAESLNHIVIDGASVGEAVASVGFCDLKRFHSHFKREMGSVPSQFKLPRPILRK